MDDDFSIEILEIKDSSFREDAIRISKFVENQGYSEDEAISLFLNLLAMIIIDQENQEETLQFWMKGLRTILSANKNSL